MNTITNVPTVVKSGNVQHMIAAAHLSTCVQTVSCS